jgi:hypothetical protein
VKNAALVIENTEGVRLSLTPEFHLVKARALETARAVDAVTDKDTMDLATRALAQVSGILKTLEESRNAVKAPVLKIGREIDSIAKEAAEELGREKARLKAGMDAYYREEARKAEAARRLSEKIADAKRQKEEEIIRAQQEEQRKLEEAAQKSNDQAESERLQQEAAERARLADEAAKRQEEIEAKEVKAPEKSEGMIVRKVWKHRVTDIHALYKARPELVTLEAKTNAINAVIRQGGEREIPGLEIYEEIDTTVRS